MLDKCNNIMYYLIIVMITVIGTIMRNTKQKEAILAAVNSIKTHPTADEIYSSLKQEHSKLSLGTVYRNLNTFSENGKIRKIPIPGFGDRFDFNITDHEHFSCSECGRVFDVHLSTPIEEIVSKDGIAISGYNLMLYGVCKECRKLN